MQATLRSAALAILLASIGTAAVRAVPAGQPKFLAPDVKTAGDIPFPPNSMAAGAVSLLLALDATGQVQNVQVLRDFPSLTGVVQSAVQTWQFAPATLGGAHVPADLSVSAVFNPYNPGGTSFQTLVLPPPAFTPAPAPGGPNFVPPQILSGTFAKYPANSVAWGAVVLDVRIDSAGLVTNVRAVRKVASLTTPAMNAVQTWAFNPATLDGHAVGANLVVAFVFPRNTAGP
ncbi:MAG TPA: energy transducer TonB [Candidatus Acidoferrales bacterium]|nr:energy transducer TonB [Candidatus Acidoferrales bacterium]